MTLFEYRFPLPAGIGCFNVSLFLSTFFFTSKKRSFHLNEKVMRTGERPFPETNVSFLHYICFFMNFHRYFLMSLYVDDVRDDAIVHVFPPAMDFPPIIIILLEFILLVLSHHTISGTIGQPWVKYIDRKFDDKFDFIGV